MRVKPGVGVAGRVTANQENRIEWRVLVALIGSDGTVRSHEVSPGGTNTAECPAATGGLTLADGERTLPGSRDRLARPSAQPAVICNEGHVGQSQNARRYQEIRVQQCQQRCAEITISLVAQAKPQRAPREAAV